MEYEDENQAELVRAKGLIKKAEELAQEGKIKNAVAIYSKALNIYLNAGAYIKIAEVFNLLVANVSMESQILPVMEKLRNVLITVENLDIPEEEAKLKMALANLMYKSADYLNAGNLYIEIAELFFKVDPEDYRQASGMFFLRAAECFEKIGRSERAEKIVLEAIKRFDMSNFNYRAALKDLNSLFEKNKLEEFIEVLREIAGFFRTLELELRHLPATDTAFENLKRNVSARLIHMVSEYNLLKMVAYRFVGNEKKVKIQADKSIKDLKEAIRFMKEMIIEGYYSSADLHRLTFDIFMLQVFQEFADYQIEDPVNLVLSKLPNEIQNIIKKMKFFEYTSQIVELNLKDQIDSLKDISLSQILDPYRDFLFDGISKSVQRFSL